MTILNRSNNNRSVLWKWTFSYLCLLFIPTLTIFINYFTNLSALKKEYTNAYQLMLQNYEITLNDKTTNMHNFYNYVVNLDSFNSIIKYQTKDKYFYNTSYLLQQALFQNKYGNDDLNCTIYLSQVDFIASSNNSCHRLLFHSSLQDSSDLIPEYEEWQDFMSGHFTENCFINTNLSDSNSPCLIYAQTLFRGLKGPVTIFISTPLDKIFTTIGNMQNGVSLLLHTADNKLFLLDKNGITATNEEFLVFLGNSAKENNVAVSGFNELGTEVKGGIYRTVFDFELKGSSVDINKVLEDINNMGIKCSFGSVSYRQNEGFDYLKRFFDDISELPWYKEKEDDDKNNLKVNGSLWSDDKMKEEK